MARNRSTSSTSQFDRSSGLLYVWHGIKDGGVLGVLQLGSRPVPGGTFRAFHAARTYLGPGERRYEGLALRPIEDCGPLGRGLFLTVDDGKAHALFQFGQFAPGCERAAPERDDPPGNSDG